MHISRREILRLLGLAPVVVPAIAREAIAMPASRALIPAGSTVAVDIEDKTPIDLLSYSFTWSAKIEPGVDDTSGEIPMGAGAANQHYLITGMSMWFDSQTKVRRIAKVLHSTAFRLGINDKTFMEISICNLCSAGLGSPVPFLIPIAVHPNESIKLSMLRRIPQLNDIKRPVQMIVRLDGMMAFDRRSALPTTAPAVLTPASAAV